MVLGGSLHWIFQLVSICILSTLLLQPISTDCFMYQYLTPNGNELSSITIWLAQFILAIGDVKKNFSISLISIL